MTPLLRQSFSHKKINKLSNRLSIVVGPAVCFSKLANLRFSNTSSTIVKAVAFVQCPSYPNMIDKYNSYSLPENVIVNYGEVNRQSDYPTVKQESHPPPKKTFPMSEPTGKCRDRVGSAGCLHPEPDIRPPQRPQLGRRERAYLPWGKNFLRGGDHRGRS